MADLGPAWLAAGLAASAAVLLALRVATEGARTRALREEADALRRERRAARKHQEQLDKALRGSEAELARASSRLAQLDRRAARARETSRAEREASAERLHALEEELAQQGALVRARSEELGRVRGELEASLAHVARAESRVRTLEEAAASAPPPADPAELAALRDRAESAEQKLAERDAVLAQATREVERLKRKVETQETLYTSIRGELAVKKDEIRQQREEIERLGATNAALTAAVSD